MSNRGTSMNYPRIHKQFPVEEVTDVMKRLSYFTRPAHLIRPEGYVETHEFARDVGVWYLSARRFTHVTNLSVEWSYVVGCQFEKQDGKTYYTLRNGSYHEQVSSEFIYRHRNEAEAVATAIQLSPGFIKAVADGTRSVSGSRAEFDFIPKDQDSKSGLRALLDLQFTESNEESPAGFQETHEFKPFEKVWFPNVGGAPFLYTLLRGYVLAKDFYTYWIYVPEDGLLNVVKTCAFRYKDSLEELMETAQDDNETAAFERVKNAIEEFSTLTDYVPQIHILGRLGGPTLDII